MSSISYIQKDIQAIAEAISSVSQVNVTIVDENLIRIGGTGVYKNKINEKLDYFSAFATSIREKKSFVIENPKIDSVCFQCRARENCIEFAEVCCPIMYNGNSKGAIGLIAFNEYEKEKIIEDKNKLLSFLEKMSKLISDKLDAQIKSINLEVESKRIMFLLNHISKSIASFDEDMKLQIWNKEFENIYASNKNELLVKGITLKDIISDKIESRGKLFWKTFNGDYILTKIKIENKTKGYLLELKSREDTIKEYRQIVGLDYTMSFDGIIGESFAIKKVKNQALRASKSVSTVFINGESGTGKELFARAIHSASDRSKNPFVAINCAAIPDNLLESELFGYEEGSFTGAKKGGKIGKFELADKGTLFLDEIGDLSLHLQAKLLRVLQDMRVERIGAKEQIQIDTRIIVATNKNLEQMVQKAEFREDLFYRLNVIPIKIPPLREREGDIKILFAEILEICCKKLNKEINSITENAMQILLNYSWPGNVRELQNAIEYAVNMSVNNIILTENLPERLKEKKISNQNLEKIDFKTIKEMEICMIKNSINRNKNFKKSMEKSAEELGISRATLYRKIKEYNIEI